MEQLSTHEAFDFLVSQPVAHLGTVLDGEPYVTPMSYVVDGNRVLFRTVSGTKLDALRAKPSVCIEVSEYDTESGAWKSVIVRGEASLVEDAGMIRTVIGLLYSKYQGALGSPLSGGGGLRPLGGNPYVVQVPIVEITGMCSGRGMSVRTKPGRM